MVTLTTGGEFVKSVDTCISTLIGTASCTFTVTFAPVVTAPASASLQISANPGGTINVILSGHGV